MAAALEIGICMVNPLDHEDSEVFEVLLQENPYGQKDFLMGMKSSPKILVIMWISSVRRHVNLCIRGCMELPASAPNRKLQWMHPALHKSG